VASEGTSLRFRNASTPASEKIWGLVSGLPGRRRTARQLLMLQAFIDDSGKGQGDLFVLAGYIAPAQVWAESFVPRWQKLLDLGPPHHRRIEVFKMREMLGAPEQSSWFYRAIEDSVTAEVSCTINVAGLHKAYREFPWPFLFDHAEALTNPYYFAFHAIIDKLAQHQHLLKIDEPVDFIFDNAAEKKHCVEGWDDIKRYSRPEVRALMGDTPSFKDDAATLPLQAADMLAYWVREWEHQGSHGQLENMKFPWDRHKTIPGLSFRFDEKDFIAEFSKMFDPEIRERMLQPGGGFPNPSMLDFYRPAESNSNFGFKGLGRMELSSLPISNRDSVRSVYANNVTMAFGPWDIRFAFSEISQDSKGELAHELKANLVMSPAHAKALVGTLSTALKKYEEQFGEIIQPKPNAPAGKTE
jgi:hypothetical protein